MGVMIMGIKRVILDLDENVYDVINQHARKDRRSTRAFLHILLEDGIKRLGIVSNKTDSNDEF